MAKVNSTLGMLKIINQRHMAKIAQLAARLRFSFRRVSGFSTWVKMMTPKRVFTTSASPPPNEFLARMSTGLAPPKR
jgi:hypothetical protein